MKTATPCRLTQTWLLVARIASALQHRMLCEVYLRGHKDQGGGEAEHQESKKGVPGKYLILFRILGPEYFADKLNVARRF